jgi:hypothetical protein
MRNEVINDATPETSRKKYFSLSYLTPHMSVTVIEQYKNRAYSLVLKRNSTLTGRHDGKIQCT